MLQKSESNLAKHAGRRVRGLADTAIADLEKWPTPDEGALKEGDLKEYLSRKQAIKAYLEGHSDRYIRESFSVSLVHIYRLITERCLAPHPDGLIYGWRALIPYIHINPYRRKKAVKVGKFGEGAAGAMQTVLDVHPDLRKAFEKRILKSSKLDELGPSKRPRQAHWKWFLGRLREFGYEIRQEWPFNTENNGYVTVCRYIDTVLENNPQKAVQAIGGPDLKRKFLCGDGVDRPIREVFQRVEMDAHKIDGRFCVMLPQPYGGYVTRIVHRIWVLVIIEVVSKAVLGYHLSFRREVSKEDVLRTLKKSLSPWRPRPLFFSDEAYANDAGYPSNVSHHFLRVCWDEICVDGALALKANDVKETLRVAVGSKLTDPSDGFSSRRSKDDRPFIEAFFKKIGSLGFQKMTNTTGGKPNGSQGRDPAQVAINSQFQIEYAEELLDVIIANYNARPHTTLGGRSPLQYLLFIASRDDLSLRYADPNAVQSILSYRKKCMVKGGIKEGRRPYINFDGARYSGDALSQRFDLVGQYIWIVNHLEEDARIAEASTLNGMPLGILRAAPPWHRLPHSLAVRRAINSCVRREMFSIASGLDAVEIFLDFCEQQKGKKLPVHPAYLEARRILVNQSELRTGKSVLEAALASVIDEKAKQRVKAQDQIDNNLNKEENLGPEMEVTRCLPLRRLAASGQ